LHLKRLTSKNTRTTRMWSAVFTNAICWYRNQQFSIKDHSRSK
jgi:hypothetical protein